MVPASRVCQGQLLCKVSSSQLTLLQRNELYFLTRRKFSRRRKILTKSVEREIKVKGTGSRRLLEECVKDNYYARFHTHS